MAWCHQATSHYLSQCWRRSVLPYGIHRPQKVKPASLQSLLHTGIYIHIQFLAAHVAIRAIWPPSISPIPLPHHFQPVLLKHMLLSELLSEPLDLPPSHPFHSLITSKLFYPSSRSTYCYQSHLTSIHPFDSIPSSLPIHLPLVLQRTLLSEPFDLPPSHPFHSLITSNLSSCSTLLSEPFDFPPSHQFHSLNISNLSCSTLLSEPSDLPPSHPFHSLITFNLFYLSSSSTCCYQSHFISLHLTYSVPSSLPTSPTCPPAACCYQSHLTSLHLTNSIPSSLPTFPPAPHAAIRAIWPPSISPIPFPHHFHPVLLQHMLLSEPFDLPLYHPFHSLITLNLSYLSSSSTCCYQSQLASFLLQAVGSCHRQTYTGCSEWMTNTQGPAP